MLNSFKAHVGSEAGIVEGLAKVLWAIPQCSEPVYPDSEAAGFLVDFELRWTSFKLLEIW